MLYMSLFLHQTTTVSSLSAWVLTLYMSLFLHQTTTGNLLCKQFTLLYMSLFLHQTTTVQQLLNSILSCICLFSYIKPQLSRFYRIVGTSCICLFSYIKPQLTIPSRKVESVVYVSFPTSNHNLPPIIRIFPSDDQLSILH